MTAPTAPDHAADRYGGAFLRRRNRSALGSNSEAVRRAAHEFAREAFAAHRLPVQEAGEVGALLVERGGGQALVRVLGAAAPHLRGGRGNLGLHWMLTDPAADFVAVVDLSRSQGWLFPGDVFRRRAQMLPGPRFHLDWLVARFGATRSRVPDEPEFDEYRFERALARYFGPSTGEVER